MGKYCCVQFQSDYIRSFRGRNSNCRTIIAVRNSRISYFGRNAYCMTYTCVPTLYYTGSRSLQLSTGRRDGRKRERDRVRSRKNKTKKGKPVRATTMTTTTTTTSSGFREFPTTTSSSHRSLLPRRAYVASPRIYYNTYATRVYTNMYIIRFYYLYVVNASPNERVVFFFIFFFYTFLSFRFIFIFFSPLPPCRS